MKKGFTLIELLAVIVILAIIALIATPIILGIINDARKESNERSVELYASAVRNAIASYQLTHPNAPTSFEDLDVQYDGNVICGTEQLYEDGSFYIANCTVNGTQVDYEYGTKQQIYKPQYYSWPSYVKIGGDLPSDAKTTVSELNPGYAIYVGLDVDADNKVIASYGCFTRNETEYCLKLNDFAKSTEIIKDAFADVVDTDACSFEDDLYRCAAGGLDIDAYLDGTVNVFSGYGECLSNPGGEFACSVLPM